MSTFSCSWEGTRGRVRGAWQYRRERLSDEAQPLRGADDSASEPAERSQGVVFV